MLAYQSCSEMCFITWYPFSPGRLFTDVLTLKRKTRNPSPRSWQCDPGCLMPTSTAGSTRSSKVGSVTSPYSASRRFSFENDFSRVSDHEHAFLLSLMSFSKCSICLFVVVQITKSIAALELD